MKESRNKMTNVPNLRFPEFEGEWETRAFSDIGTFFKGIGISKEQLTEEGTPCILYGELYTKYKNEVIKEVKSKTSINTNGLVFSKANDVIIPSSGESAIDISTACCVTLDNILLGGDLNVIRPKKHNGSFISYQLNGKRKYDIAKIAQGSSIIHLYNDSLNKIKINVPRDIKEEDKIVVMLSLLDDRISTQIQIINNLQSLIKGLIQTLVFENRIGWRKQYLRDILAERKELNEKSYPIYSVAVNKGVVNQIEHLGRSFAAQNTTNYNVVRYGDIIYTKSPTGSFPYGIIKQSFVEYPVAVSPLYGVYRPVNIYLGNILHHFFNSPVNTNNYLHSLIQKGAKNTISITNQRFLDKELFLPTDKKEIERIHFSLSAIQNKIELENKIKELLVKQKKYLLANIFI